MSLYKNSSQAAPLLYRLCPARQFVTTPAPRAGHNKWTKTKNIKATTDKKKQSERTNFSRLITLYSRMHGEHPVFNPQLSNAIAAATKASIPKSIIEAAIARGQGRSAEGAKLEHVSIGVRMPPDIALIVDIETDKKSRTMQDFKLTIKKCGALIDSTTFLFSRRGRAVLVSNKGGSSFAQVFEKCIELEGVEDVEELPDGGILLWTQPPSLMSVTGMISELFKLEVLEADIVWAPNPDTQVPIDSHETAQALDALFSGMREIPEVKTIYTNAQQGGIADEVWSRIKRNADIY